MDCHRAYYLALLEGFTEFLPVSAASHLILLPILFGWTEPSPAIMVATRIGTLLAVVIYFLDTLRAMAIGGIQFLRGKAGGAEVRLAGYLVLGSLPIALSAFAIGNRLGPVLNHPLAIAATTVVFAVVLGLARKLGSEHRGETDLDWKDALIVGLCQAIGLAPGVSRTGMTLTGGLLRGLDRRTAARFSYLLSIPVTAWTGLAETSALIRSPEPVAWWNWFLAALLSGVVAYITIAWFLKWVGRIGMLPFVIYRILLGGFILVVFL